MVSMTMKAKMWYAKVRKLQVVVCSAYFYPHVDMISRKDQTLQALIPNVDNKDEFLNLVSLVYKHGAYWIYHSKSLKDDTFQNHADRVWKIVKYECYNNRKLNTCELQEEDVIKFGRVRFKVKKLVVDPDLIDNDNDDNDDGYTIPTRNNIPVDTSANQGLRGILTSLENEAQLNPATEPDTRVSTMQFSQGAGEHVGFEPKTIPAETGKLDQELLSKSQHESQIH